MVIENNSESNYKKPAHKRRRVARVVRSASHAEEHRRRLEKLKREVADGSYWPSALEIAKAMIRELKGSLEP